MKKGDYYTFKRNDGITLMSYERYTNDMNRFYIIATSTEFDRDFVGEVLPWNNNLLNKLIKVDDLNDKEKQEVIISIWEII